MRTRHILAGVLTAAALQPVAMAQESINTPAAVQTAQGRIAPRFQLRYTEFGADPDGNGGEGRDWTVLTTVEYGLLSNLSLTLDAPFTYRERDRAGADDRSTSGVGEVATSVKWRVWQNDFGPVDTARFGFFGGMEWPTGQDEFSSASFDPFVGAAFTTIFGRHGFNQSLAWKFTTGGFENPVYSGESTADELRFDSAYLFRIYPEAYSERFEASWYVVAEVNGTYETNGDHEILFAPGLLYEATGWAAEASVQLPLTRNLDHRPETDISVVIGVRLLF